MHGKKIPQLIFRADQKQKKQDSKDLNPKPLANAPKTNSTNTPKTLKSTDVCKT